MNLWGNNYNPNQINCIAYANGYWVVGGQYRLGDTYCARIAYTTNLDGTWTTNDVWSAGNTYNTINCITYANGCWVVGGQSKASALGSYYARIAYATSLDGTWTTKNLWGTSSVSGQVDNIHCITYTNGYWVAGGCCYDSGPCYARIAYTTNLDGTWTTKDLWSSNNYYNQINCITYANGYWVAGGEYFTGSTYYARIAYATSLDGTWTTKNLWDTPSSGITCITYANGYWVVGGQYYDGSTYYARIAYTASPDGTWTTNDVWGYASPSSAGIANNIHCITYANGYWVAGGEYYASESHYARIAYAGSPTELGQTS